MIRNSPTPWSGSLEQLHVCPWQRYMKASMRNTSCSRAASTTPSPRRGHGQGFSQRMCFRLGAADSPSACIGWGWRCRRLHLSSSSRARSRRTIVSRRGPGRTGGLAASRLARGQLGRLGQPAARAKAAAIRPWRSSHLSVSVMPQVLSQTVRSRISNLMAPGHKYLGPSGFGAAHAAFRPRLRKRRRCVYRLGPPAARNNARYPLRLSPEKPCY